MHEQQRGAGDPPRPAGAASSRERALYGERAGLARTRTRSRRLSRHARRPSRSRTARPRSPIDHAVSSPRALAGQDQRRVDVVPRPLPHSPPTPRLPRRLAHDCGDLGLGGSGSRGYRSPRYLHLVPCSRHLRRPATRLSSGSSGRAYSTSQRRPAVGRRAGARTTVRSPPRPSCAGRGSRSPPTSGPRAGRGCRGAIFARRAPPASQAGDDLDVGRLGVEQRAAAAASDPPRELRRSPSCSAAPQPEQRASHRGRPGGVSATRRARGARAGRSAAGSTTSPVLQPGCAPRRSPARRSRSVGVRRSTLVDFPSRSPPGTAAALAVDDLAPRVTSVTS